MKMFCRETGQRLREARMRAKLSQQQVADAVGVTRQMVSRWEKGDPLPNNDHWYKLGMLYGTCLSYLVYGPVLSKLLTRPAGVDRPPAAREQALDLRPA